MSEFSDLVDRVRTAESQNKDLYLGRLCWYSFSNVQVDHGDVIRSLVQEGISTNMPLPPKDADVFRRVSTEAQRKRVATHDDDIFENYLVRELSSKSDEHITRRIVVEQVDRKGKKLAYEQLADVTFHRVTSAISFQYISLPATPSALSFGSHWQTTAQEITQTIQQEFAAWQGKLNTYSVREWTRHFIEGTLRGTKVRPGGGVYFVSEDHADKINGLEKFVHSVKGNCEFHSLPLVDDRKQRDMLQRAFEAETADAIDEVLADIEELKESGKKISPEAYEKFVTRYQGLTSKTQEYSDLLESKLTGTTTRLDIYQRSMVDLLAAVKH